MLQKAKGEAGCYDTKPIYAIDDLCMEVAGSLENVGS